MLHSVKKVIKSDFYSMIPEKAGSCTGCSVFNLSALSLSRLALREVFFDHIMFFECFSNNFTIRAFHRSLKCFQSLLEFAHGDVLILKFILIREFLEQKYYLWFLSISK